MDITEILIYTLATWRVASLFVNERGPLDIFMHIREFTGIEHDQDGVPAMVPGNFFAEIMACIWCTSIWVSAFWVVCDWIIPFIAVRVAAVFAVSAAAIVVDKYIQ